MFPPARPVSGVLAFAYVSVKDPALSVLQQFDSLPHRYAQLPDLNRQAHFLRPDRNKTASADYTEKHSRMMLIFLPEDISFERLCDKDDV